jgi:hypothetical protein
VLPFLIAFPTMNSQTNTSLLKRLTIFGIIASTVPNIIAATAPLAVGHIYGLKFVYERYPNLRADAGIALAVAQTVTTTAALFLCFARSFLMIWEGAKKYMPNTADRRIDRHPSLLLLLLLVMLQGVVLNSRDVTYFFPAKHTRDMTGLGDPSPIF